MKACPNFKRGITFLLSEQWHICLNTDIYTSALGRLLFSDAGHSRGLQAWFLCVLFYVASCVILSTIVCFFSGRNQNQKWPGPVTPLQISRTVVAILSLCRLH